MWRVTVSCGQSGFWVNRTSQHEQRLGRTAVHSLLDLEYHRMSFELWRKKGLKCITGACASHLDEGAINCSPHMLVARIVLNVRIGQDERRPAQSIA